MKYVVLLGEGISDGPVVALGGKTPLEVARTPHLDHMASRGLLGLTRIAERKATSTGAAGVLAVLGYDPAQFPSCYGPLDAAGLGIVLGPQDIAFRLDLITVAPNDAGVEVLRDATAARLPEADARALAGDLAASLARDTLELYPTHGARLLLVWRGGDAAVQTTPAHALIDKPAAERQPTGPRAEVLRDLITRSRQLLASHPVCAAYQAAGEPAPTALWPWGQGGAMRVPPLRERRGVTGVVVAADPFVRGAGAVAGLRVLDVPADADPATLVASGLAALADADLLVLHEGAAADASLAGDATRKVAAIERFDAEVVGPTLAGLRQGGDAWRVLLMPDVEISCTLRRPTPEAIPFAVYVASDDAKTTGASRAFHERDARDCGIYLPEAHGLMQRILRH